MDASIVIFSLVASSIMWVCFFCYAFISFPEQIEGKSRDFIYGVILAIIGILIVSLITVFATITVVLALFQ